MYKRQGVATGAVVIVPVLSLLQAKYGIGEVTAAHPPVSYTHLRAHETVLDLVCRLLLEKKKSQTAHPHSD